MNRNPLASWTLTAGLLLTATNVFAQITVEQDGSGDHTTITAAINAAEDGDLILIGPGTYAEGPISFLGKELTLDGVDATTRIVQAAVDGDSIFIIDGGQEEIVNAIENLTISGARASANGGGILLSDQSSLYVVDCTFEDNQSGENFNGGGLCITNQSRCTVEGCLFTDNTATGGRGGGLYVSNDSELFISSTEFIGNFAGVGGGACIDRPGDCSFDRCLFAGNTAGSGGGLSIGSNEGKSAGLDAPMVVSCAFSGNTAATGGAIRMVTYDDPGDFTIGGVGYVDNCTFSRNSANASPVVRAVASIATDAIILRNCIVWQNSGALSALFLIPDFTNCQLDEAYRKRIFETPGSSMLENVSVVDPRFIDELGPDGVAGTGDENLRVMPGSPVIDQGTSAVGLTSANFDLGGNARRIDDPLASDGPGSGTPPIDRGAYELDPTRFSEQGFAIWEGEGLDDGLLDEDNWLDGVVSDPTHAWVFDADGALPSVATAERGQALIGELILGSGTLNLTRAEGASGVIRLKDGPSTSASDYASLRITPFVGEEGSLRLSTGLVADDLEILNDGQLTLFDDAFIQILGGGGVRIDGAKSKLNALNFEGGTSTSTDLLNLGAMRISSHEFVVGGDYSQTGTRLDGTEAHGILAMDLLGAASDTNRLTVTGQATLGGSIAFDLGQQSPPIEAGDSFTVLRADGGLGGTTFDFAITRDNTGQDLAFILSTESTLTGGGEEVVATAVSIEDLLAGAAAGDSTAGASVQDLIFADIDGDGYEDMILSIDNGGSAGSVAVLLNEGVSGVAWDGFESYGTWLFTVGVGPRGLDVGFINDDDAFDVVVANYTDGTFSVLLNTSTPGVVSFSESLGSPFDSDPNFPTTSNPLDVCLKNLDGDPLNLSDVMVTNERDGAVWTFQNTSTFFSTSLDNEQESTPPKAIKRFSPGRGGGVRNDDTVGTSDSDDGTSSGKPDPGSLASGTGITMIWTGNDTPPGSAPVDLATADFNGDGRIDVATANQGDSTISIFTDTGIGDYDPATTFDLPLIFSDPVSISAGDLDADGDIDLSYIAEFGGQLVTATIRNTLAAPEGSYGWVLNTDDRDLGGQGPFLIRTSDVDNDGDDDVIALVTSSSLLAGDDESIPGFFTTEMRAVDPENETCVGDYDGDGVVAGSDLATLLGAWGSEDPKVNLTGDVLIDGADLASLLAAWGVCEDEESFVD